MTKIKKFALALVGCSLVAGVAVAAPKWDTNGDGTITAEEKAQHRAEMKAKRMEMRKQMLLKFDTNRDGQLDQAERQAMHEARTAEAFKRLDADGNGQISLAEFKQGKKFFKHHRGGKFGKRGSGLKTQ